MAHENPQVAGEEWVSFPGGELEGKRPKVLCEACREALKREAAGRLDRKRDSERSGACEGSSASGLSNSSSPSHPASASRLASLSSPSRPLCFQCYRANLDRERAIRDAGRLDTASEERFQSQLPFEPVDRPRLEMLKVDRARARDASVVGVGRFVDKRRQAQIAARHALQTIAQGLRARGAKATGSSAATGTAAATNGAAATGTNAAADATAATYADREIAMAIHAAELQLPDAWIPFVVAR